MEPFNLDYPCPAWLEDEALLIEHAGEMPEVALAESLHILGELPLEDLASLRAACARGYVLNIKRDLDPANLGLPVFRGLDRARANLGRLERFLTGFGAELPGAVRGDLVTELVDFLQAEQSALDGGRPYTAAPLDQLNPLAKSLDLDLKPWQGLLKRLPNLPAPDFIGLRALKRLSCPDPAYKRRLVRGDQLLIELLDSTGACLTRAALPWHSDAPAVAAENQDRAEMIWKLLETLQEPVPKSGGQT